MKLILTILLFISFTSKATNYYIDNSGSDLNNGLSPGTAWQTVAKVNASTFLPDDSILFFRNGTWIERLVLQSSGTAGHPIIVAAYGAGNKPLITGLQTQGGFTNVGNVWTATASSAAKQLNTVLVNGLLRPKARTPNTGWSTFSSYVSNTQITTALPPTPDYTGSDLVVRTSHWVIDKSLITSQSGGVLNFYPGLTYTPSLGGNGYFIQNTASDLDVVGEWAFDSTSKVLKVYATTSPTVQISTLDTLVWLRGKSYITFSGLSFQGANKSAFQLDTASHITIYNCLINYSGSLAVSGLKSPYVSIVKDTIQNTFSGAIYLRQVDPYTPTVNVCDNAVIDSNYIKNTAVFPGMGLNSNGRYEAINVIGLSPHIANNKIDSTGYMAIVWAGQNAIIRKNYITNFCFVKDDGGGIYTVIGAYLPLTYNDGGIVDSNIVINGVGASAGTSTTSYAPGIYLDDQVKNITINSNSLSGGFGTELFLNNADSNTVTNNTIIDGIGWVFQYSGAVVSGGIVKNNIFYSSSASYETMARFNGTNLGIIDSNFYSRPLNENNSLNLNGPTYNLAGWQVATGKDTHSTSTPLGITSAAPVFVYNPSQADSTISFAGRRKDSKGNVYTSSITLHPFISALLFTVPDYVITGRLKPGRYLKSISK